MKLPGLVFVFLLLRYSAAEAQLLVLNSADTVRFTLSSAALTREFLPLSTLLAGMPVAAQEAVQEGQMNHDRQRYESMERQGALPAEGFAYRVTVCFGADGFARYVFITPTGLVTDRALQDLLGRLTVFYRETRVSPTPGKPFSVQFQTFFGRPLGPRTVRRPAPGTIGTLEAARLTTRPDTVKILFFNQLNLKTIPEEVYRFTNLEELDLSKNYLTALPVRLTVDLPNLQKLSFLVNQLGDDSVFLTKNNRLKALTLQGNKLTRIPKSVRNCRALESLWMGNNSLAVLNVRALRGLKHLTDLNFYNAALTTLPRAIRRLKTVRVLDLYYNNLTEVPRQLGRMRALTELALAHNRLTALPPALAKLSWLHTLFVHHNQLSDLPPQLAQLPALRQLDLGYNRFSHVPDVVLQMPGLESLNLGNNNIQTLPSTLAGLKKLRVLYLRSNPVSTFDGKTGPYAPLIEALEANKTEVLY